MLTIYKYELALEDTFDVMMPKGAKILSVQTQRGKPCVWVEVDDAEPVEYPRRFHVRGTGHPMGDAVGATFVDTFQLDGGILVFHVFVQ